MKLSEYARRVGVNYKTAWRWWRAGTLDTYQAASGTVSVREPAEPAETATLSAATHHVAIYARVWAAENRPTLECQAEQLITYRAAKGNQVHQVVKEIGSGVNESRPKFLQVLADPTIKLVVVEHQDRATRCGFRFLESLLEQQGRPIQLLNLGETEREGLVADLGASVSSFCGRFMGGDAPSATPRPSCVN